MIQLSPKCPISQESFLSHHHVIIEFDPDDPVWGGCWGLSWSHGCMGSISLKPERAEALAVASLFVHWWLTVEGEKNPGELIRAAWFFHNPEALPAAKKEFGADPDSGPMFQFLDEQLALFAK